MPHEPRLKSMTLGRLLCVALGVLAYVVVRSMFATPLGAGLVTDAARADEIVIDPVLMYDLQGNEIVSDPEPGVMTKDDDAAVRIAPSRHSNMTLQSKQVCVNASLLASSEFASGRHLITTFYRGKKYSKARFRELVTVLERNLRNRHIKAVHTLWEDVDPVIYVNASLAHKLIRVYYPRQPTYKDLFDYSSLYLKRGSVAIVANSDIHFDPTLACVAPVRPHAKAFNATKQHLVYALSRHPAPPCASSGHDMCDVYIGSHDAFIFAPPLKRKVAVGLDFPQNRISAENVVIWEFRRMGYDVRNPCRVVRALHLHCTMERSYHMGSISHGGNRIGDVDRHASVNPSSLPRCGQVMY